MFDYLPHASSNTTEYTSPTIKIHLMITTNPLPLPLKAPQIYSSYSYYYNTPDHFPITTHPTIFSPVSYTHLRAHET